MLCRAELTWHLAMPCGAPSAHVFMSREDVEGMQIHVAHHSQSLSDSGCRAHWLRSAGSFSTFCKAWNHREHIRQVEKSEEADGSEGQSSSSNSLCHVSTCGEVYGRVLIGL